MYLYIETMDAFLVEVAPDGRIRFDNEEWARPSVQERRAIIHAAQDEIENLKELLQMLETEP
jgi:acyl-CoA reductase-like NAD-dependent aldehyde dehydrogenase